MTAPKPLLIFEGNCQAQHLAAIINGAGIAKSIYVGTDWGFYPSYRGRGCEIVSKTLVNKAPAARRKSGMKLIQLSQSTPFLLRQAKGLGALKAVDKRVFFPEVRFWVMSPRRFRKSFKAEFGIERIFELDLQSMQRSQESCQFPVDVAGFIGRESRTRSLFHTVNHPSGSVFARLLEGLATILKDDIDSMALLEVAKDIEPREGYNFQTDHPIPKDLRKALRFDWGEQYDAYAEMLSATEAKRWDELAVNRDKYEANFRTDTQFWRSYALLGQNTNNESIAIPAFERLIEVSPGALPVWLWYAHFLWARGRISEILSLLARAETFFEGANAFLGIAARVQLLLQERRKAEEHAREYWRRAPDTIQAVFPLVEVLLAEGKIDEVNSLVASLSERPGSDLERLQSFLMRLKSGHLVRIDRDFDELPA